MEAAVKVAAKPSLTIKRHLKASPAKVYAAWTDPAQVAQWMGPEGMQATLSETDPRVGGRYRFVIHAPDGEDHDVSGVYREVVPNEKLVFSWAWRSTPERESLVTILIKPDGDGSLLTLIHEQFFDEAARDRHNEGWSSCLNRLERYLS
jgi:uncharacterized protein YndB with AHSA1/START domain